MQPKFHKYFHFNRPPRCECANHWTECLFEKEVCFHWFSEPKRPATGPGLSVVCSVQCEFYPKKYRRFFPTSNQIENCMLVRCSGQCRGPGGGGGSYFYRTTATLWHIFISLVLLFPLFVFQWNRTRGRGKCSPSYGWVISPLHRNPFY